MGENILFNSLMYRILFQGGNISGHNSQVNVYAGVIIHRFVLGDKKFTGEYCRRDSIHR